MIPEVPILIEKLEPRWAPARLIAGPLPEEFGANLVSPEELEAEDVLDPEAATTIQVLDPTLPVLLEIEPEAPDLDDDDEEEIVAALPDQTSGGSLVILNRPPLIALSEDFSTEVLRLSVNEGLTNIPPIDAPALSTIDTLFRDLPALNPASPIDGNGIITSIGSLTRTGVGALSLAIPTSDLLNLGTKEVNNSVVVAVPIGSLSAVLHDALRIEPVAPVIAVSAEGSTLPIEEEIVPLPPVPDEE
jgi:hypothetical protein